GGGGGGRIAIYYKDVITFTPDKLSVRGGSGYGSGAEGTAWFIQTRGMTTQRGGPAPGDGQGLQIQLISVSSGDVASDANWHGHMRPELQIVLWWMAPPDTPVAVEFSTNLSEWTMIPAEVENVGENQYRTTLLTTEPVCFFRLRTR
ncbi:MAG TPA: hypothetical protein PLW35_11015, partial [Verrucomicrobiota bacterium]|nr:hypothetical protein [Verrucomicrobiota bacterium]